MAYLKLESQLKQEACERHIALLELNVNSLKDQLNDEQERSLRELDKKVEQACRELTGRYELEMQSYRNEQQRLQVLLAQLNEKSIKQIKVHETTT